ncbi:DUF5683 domain-containing protein [Flavobacterium sp. WG21]|uniref:DUF5683 domain-containing protein n=1 Tax=Flavobacterium sp. WG21 TaxID=1229487 RepID=UPI0003472437|nr:DUF5683 domain-containing protein [Flavobacterium sp. WG21]
MRLFIIFICFFSVSLYSQTQINEDTLNSRILDPLRPAKAGFYSAILPGSGQVYNKKYWKVPLVCGAIGTSIYFYVDNQKQYNVYRNEYKNRLSGNQSNSEYLSNLNSSQLISAQKQFRRNSNLSLLCAVGFYVLNIIDANIDASLSQFNVSKQLTCKPTVNTNNIALQNNFSLSCTYTF